MKFEKFLEGVMNKDIIVLKKSAQVKVVEEIPTGVKKFLDLASAKNLNSEGKNFVVHVEHKSNSNTGAGIARLNELIVKQLIAGEWKQVYSSGMRQYRGAYASEQDYWDLQIGEITIFEEGEGFVTFALRSGANRVKVYRYENRQLTSLLDFDLRSHENLMEQNQLANQIYGDLKSFLDFTKKGYGERWHVPYSLNTYHHEWSVYNGDGQKVHGDDVLTDKAKIVLIFANHSDRPYDAITDRYQFHVWVKDQGAWVSAIFPTGIRHPYSGASYARFNDEPIVENGRLVGFNIEVSGKSSSWSVKHELMFG